MKYNLMIDYCDKTIICKPIPEPLFYIILIVLLGLSFYLGYKFKKFKDKRIADLELVKAYRKGLRTERERLHIKDAVSLEDGKK